MLGKPIAILERASSKYSNILLGLRWVIPAVSDIELGSAARLFLSAGGAVAIFIGGAMLYWPNRPR